MAQSSAGIKLYYGETTRLSVDAAYEAPESWTEIPDVTAIPALGGEPNMLDATPLSETVMKRYINGLKDPGGAFSYTVLMSPEMLSATDAASKDPDTEGTNLKTMAFAVEFPKPLNCHYWYTGVGTAVTPGETEVDGVLTSTFYTSMTSTLTKVEGPVAGE